MNIERVEIENFGPYYGKQVVELGQHRVEGTCDWKPGMRQATASGNGQSLGLIVARDGLDWLITTHGRTHRARVLPARLAPLEVQVEPPRVHAVGARPPGNHRRNSCAT